MSSYHATQNSYDQPKRVAVAPHVHDARLEAVEWRDLLHLSRREVLTEVLLCAPWLSGSLLAITQGHPVIALACSFMLFLTGLRQVHGAFHNSLGLSRRATEWTLFVLSAVMLGSMHAIRWNHLRHHNWNHLRHHKLCMSEDDVEAMSARMPAWKALLIGPSFPWHLHRTALRLANRRERRWILAELACGAAIVCTAFGQTDWGWLRYHVIAMATGHCLTAFFAVWTVHHDCDTDVIARTIRRAVLSRASYTMFYHVEHHLFPRVPTRRLPALAMRIERIAPDLCSKRVL